MYLSLLIERPKLLQAARISLLEIPGHNKRQTTMQKYIASIDVEIIANNDDDAEEQAIAFTHSVRHPYGEAYLVDIQTERFVNGKAVYVSTFE